MRAHCCAVAGRASAGTNRLVRVSPRGVLDAWRRSVQMITAFTPSFADEATTNAQSATAKEIVNHLPADRTRVLLPGDGPPDPQILDRQNTEILQWSQHISTARWQPRVLLSKINICFFPREGPLDTPFLSISRFLGLPVAPVIYIAIAPDEIAVGPMMARSICGADCGFGNLRRIAQAVQDHFGVAIGAIHSGIKLELFHPPAEKTAHSGTGRNYGKTPNYDRAGTKPYIQFLFGRKRFLFLYRRQDSARFPEPFNAAIIPSW
jgi:hypothetical protein